MIHESDKGKWSTRFQVDFAHCKPHGLTKAQVKKALMLVWDDSNFWFQCVERQGLLDKPLEEIDKFNLEHAAGNFWAMLREKSDDAQ